MRHPLAVAVAVAVAACTTAQEAPRDRGFGRLTHADGSAWADAEVHLHFRPHAAVDDPGYGEQLMLRSDARGEFRAELQVGVAYRAWAVGPQQDDGSYEISEAIDDAVARTPILLTAMKTPQFLRRVRPTLDDSWQGVPLRWRAALRDGSAAWLEPAADGVLTLPRWPGDFVMLQAWSGGAVAWRGGFATTLALAERSGATIGSGKPKDAAQALADLQGVGQCPLPKCVMREFRLLSEQGGQPIAGADVLLDDMPCDVTPLRSDEHGVLHLAWAEDARRPDGLPFQASILPPAHGEYALHSNVRRNEGEPADERRLPGGTAARGRVTLGDGKPLAGVPVLLEGSVATGPSSSWFGAGPRVFRSDADGRFVLPGRTERFPFRVSAAWRRLKRGTTTTTLPLDARHVVRFRLLDTSGEPLAGAHASLVSVRELDAIDAEVCSSVRAMCSLRTFTHDLCRVDAGGFGTLVTPMLGVTIDLRVQGKNGLDVRLDVPWTGTEGDGPVDVVVRPR